MLSVIRLTEIAPLIKTKILTRKTTQKESYLAFGLVQLEAISILKDLKVQPNLR